MKPYLDLYDYETKRKFRKYFNTEYERDKFERKLQYSKKLIVIESGEEYVYNKKQK